MKMLIAIIQPARLQAVQEALAKIEVERMTVCDAQGYGAQLGRTTFFRGQKPKATLLRKAVLEIVVNDDFLDRTVETIENIARTGPDGSIGDGKIFVLPIEETIQIGLTTHGPGAV